MTVSEEQTTLFEPATSGLPDSPPEAREYDEGRIVGRYHDANATVTERESGERVEARNAGSLRRDGVGHVALRAFASGGERMTSYDASDLATGDHHAIRREAGRLVERGYLVKDGTLPNLAPRGRPRVDAYRITEAGLAELERLGG